MEKAMVFTYDEFKNLIHEITYETVGIWDDYDGWGFTELNIIDDEWNKWLDKFGAEVEEEINSFEDVYEFVYEMIDKKYNAKVKSIIVDSYMDAVAIIFQ